VVLQLCGSHAQAEDEMQFYPQQGCPLAFTRVYP
jgi:hypothetical protein